MGFKERETERERETHTQTQKQTHTESQNERDDYKKSVNNDEVMHVHANTFTYTVRSTMYIFFKTNNNNISQTI